MFDLEKAILNWLRELRRNPAYEDGDIVEIEDHIREEIENEHANGVSLKQAFKSSISSFGSLDSIGEEMTRSRTKHLKIPYRYSLEPAFPESKNPLVNGGAMLNNYFKIAIRNFLRQKLYSFINITGLSVGIAASILIMLYVWHELSFDRFHSKANQTYRVVMDNPNLNANGEFDKRKAGMTRSGLASALKDEFPEIIQATRLNLMWNDWEISYNEKLTYVKNRSILRADAAAIDIFDIPFISGDPKTALNEPQSILFTEEMVRKVFAEEDPLGKIIQLKFGYSSSKDYKVTGIVQSMPGNSHFDYKFIIHFNYRVFPLAYTYGEGTGTYITLPEGLDSEALEAKLPLIVNKYYIPEYKNNMTMSWDKYVESGVYPKLHLQPLKDIYLGEYRDNYSRKGNITYVYLFSILAMFIILLACVNFMTLSTARSGRRAKEVVVRKISGASRGQLIRQFLTESFLITIISLMGSLILVKLLLPSFNNFLEIQISPGFSEIGLIIIALVAIILVVGILAGSYPAFFLSVFQPVMVLKAILPSRSRVFSLRNSLVVFQFVVTIMLIIASITVYNQLSFICEIKIRAIKRNTLS